MMQDFERPGVLRWFGYALGTGLPPRYREWVLHDVTTRTWLLRHIARVTVQLAPIAVLLFVLIPGEAWIRALAVLGGLLLGYFYAFAYMYETVEHRAVKAGWPLGTAAARRDAPKQHLKDEAARLYAERYRRPPGA